MGAAGIDLLESVLAKTGSVIAGVRPGQTQLPTPCPDYDVARLVDHLLGWAHSFAARLDGATFAGDPNQYRAGPDPAAEFGVAARTMVAAYRDGREQARLPAGLLVIEFLTHGWDLATATGQPVTFTSAEAEMGLDAGRQMLKPEYRGPGKTFGEQVPVPGSGGAVDRLLGFLGRNPHWPDTSH